MQLCFKGFRQSLGYQILREDIKREEMLYEVMVEGKFIKFT